MNQAPNQNFEAKLDGIMARHAELARAMVEASGEGYAPLAKEYAELEPIAAGIQDWRAAEQEAAGLREMIADPALDRDMRALAEDELHALERRLPGSSTPSSWRCCPRTRRMTGARSWRSGPGRAARRRRCSPAICTVCTSATPSCAAGTSSRCR